MVAFFPELIFFTKSPKMYTYTWKKYLPVIIDRESGRSRGFGFVEMGSDDEANSAMKALNNKDIEGRAMSVTVAREKSTKG